MYIESLSHDRSLSRAHAIRALTLSLGVLRPIVQPGVYFQLRYVILVMAEGIPRPPLPLELATAPLVRHSHPNSRW